MDVEKLIRRLRNDADAYRNGETLGRAFADQEDVLDNAATALSTLQAENEKLRAELEQARPDCAVAEKNHADCIDELEQVKRERDAVLNAFRGFIQLGHLCEYCAETLKDDPACSACEKWSKFQWRGAAEE